MDLKRRMYSSCLLSICILEFKSNRNVNEFIQLYRQHNLGYENVFEKRAFGGELELQELIEYFHECDLYPTAMQLDEAFDSVFRGKLHKYTKLL